MTETDPSRDPLGRRYHRQALLAGIGEDGQERLHRSAAFIVGVGALGCVVADCLARAGVGTLMVVDRDVVEPTNLQRQSLYTETDALDRVPKVEAAARRLAEVNQDVHVVPVAREFSWKNAERLASGADVLIDATDNFLARYLLNDVAVKHSVPMVYAGAVATRGMTMTIRPGATPCLRCLHPELPRASETCDTVGVLGPLIHVVAGMQAAEAIKVLSGNVQACAPGLRTVDLWSGVMRTIAVGDGPDGECPCCRGREFEFLSGAIGVGGAALCGREAVQIRPAARSTLDLDALASVLGPHATLTRSAHALRAELRAEALELTVFTDGRAIVAGTDDEEEARGVYARYVGS
ncbi:MAG: ThiF family adenylyltransferase [Planctomycetota bacterium]